MPTSIAPSVRTGLALCTSITFALGFVACLVLALFIPGWARAQLKQQLPPIPANKDQHDTWLNGPKNDPAYTNYYLWNVTNPYDILFNQAKPKLQKVGPFVYQQFIVKGNVSFTADQTEVNYTYRQTYKFMPIMSGPLNEDTPITMLNFGLLGVSNVVAADPSLPLGLGFLCFFKPCKEALKWDGGEGPFITHTAKELLWGYESKWAAIMNISNIPLTYSLQTNDDPTFWSRITTEKTGKGNISEIGQISRWSGYTEIHIPGDPVNLLWGSPQANAIWGTNAHQFQPLLNKKNPPNVKVFVDDLLRSSVLVPNGTISFRGIDLIRYVIPDSDLASVKYNPENAGFYDFGWSGTLNMSNTQQGAPAFYSKPHFLTADVFEDGKVLSERVEIPKADWDRDNTFIDVEPTTGAPIHVLKRLQGNFRLDQTGLTLWSLLSPPSHGFNMSKDWSLFPLAVVEESFSLTAASADKLKHQVLFPINTLPSILVGLAVACGVFTAFSVVMYFRALESDTDESDNVRLGGSKGYGTIGSTTMQ